MRDTLAFEILTNMMNDDWRADSPVPSTSQELDPVICLDNTEVRLDTQETPLDPSYEETIQSFYSEDSQSDPLWTSSSYSAQASSSSPLGGDNSFDFLSDDCFMDASMNDIKGELKSRIKAKRLASGQEEITVEFAKPTSTGKEMTEDEIQLYHERKEKNRLAAQKCRNKKRERVEVLENDIDRLETKQGRLKDEIQRLQDEREHLKEVIQIHGVVCPKIRKLGDS